MTFKLRRRPLIVGLTGNFGSGKSTVAKLFQKKGAQVLDADRLAHEAFKKGNPLHSRLRSLFPEVSGTLARSKVARVVFQNPKKRRALESLIHPYVFKRIKEKIQSRREGIVILEVPLLFESGFHRGCDRTIVVRAEARKTFRRLTGMGYSRSEIAARWKAQMPLREKLKRADYFIDNSDGLGKTRRQVDKIWRELKRERSLSKHGEGERQ